MTNRLPILIVAIFLSGCATYSAVSTSEQTFKSITVTPDGSWNKAPAIASPGGAPTWTADGVILNSFSFFSDIGDGDSLIKSSSTEKFAQFKADMLPNEIADLAEGTIVKELGATVKKRGTLKPLKIDGHPGFAYTFDYVTPDKVIRRAYIAGAVKDDQLQLFFYQAARMHYYGRHFASVENMIAGARIK